MSSTQAVFFDVDFTLIYPGPAFQGEGYRAFCARHGMEVEPSPVSGCGDHLPRTFSIASRTRCTTRRFSSTTRRTSSEPWEAAAQLWSRALRKFIRSGPSASTFCCTTTCRRRFEALAAEDICIGLISNSHRCLEAFQEHFELDGLIDVAVSSSQHGFMKPHPSIFEAALKLAGVPAAEALMVGDSLTQDIDGARRVGMRGVLVTEIGNGSRARSKPTCR